MKDNIKEFIEFRTDEDGTYFYYNDKDNIEQWSYKLDELKDYITNLQEENKVLLEKYSTIQILYNSSKSNIDETVKYLKIQIDDYKEELQKTEDEDVKLFCIHKIDTYNELLNILQGGFDE